MNIKLTILSSALLVATQISAATATLGFSNGNSARETAFRVGSTELQGLAIKLDSEKLSLLKGCTVTGIDAVFGSSRTTGNTVDLFISTTPGGEPLVKKTVEISKATTWLSFDLDTPYVITGDEAELYIGYTGSISTSGNLLSADLSADMGGCNFAYLDGEWVDMFGLGVGSPNIRVRVDGAPDFVDAIIKPMEIEGYFKANNPYTLNGQIFNFGTETIKSFDIRANFGGEGMQTVEFRDLDIPCGSTYDFTFPDFVSERSGAMDVSVEIVNVNGGDDASAGDNLFNAGAFFYPQDMERNILLEGFTGVACHNCPSGHQTINAFLEGVIGDKVVEIMHHSGYQPDIYSMDDDYEYTLFYGSSSTFAPAVMLNRTHFPLLGNVPVLNTVKSDLEKGYADLEKNSQPYVSMKLESSYDPDSRMVTVTVKSYTHNDLPAEQNVINVILCQNGIVGNQSGAGSAYVHNAVSRGSVVGNAWGLLLEEGSRMGETVTWSKTFKLEESIFSDFWASQATTESARANYMIPTDPDNMYLVAYVAEYGGNNPNANRIYNCIETKLGESHEQKGMSSGIGAVADDDFAPAIVVSGGYITVAGSHDSVQVFDLSGKAYNPANRLSAGLYIVRVVAGNHIATRKVVVK